MKNFIVLFREPDGRTDPHPAEEVARHQEKVRGWFAEWGAKGHIAGGSGLTLEGSLIDTDGQASGGIYRVGTEIVGGFMLLKANDLSEATDIARTCPVLEFGAFAEVREMQG
jgi:hypothetical protein